MNQSDPAVQSTPAPSFYVGNIPIYGRVILAPMDGLSDQPTRSFYRKFGSAISYSEFLNTIDILHWNRNIETRSSFTEGERPIAFQLLDNDPVRMLQAAKIMFPFKPDIFDINFGCPARVVTSRGAGASLLRQPDVIGTMVAQFTKEFDIPVTAKIRLGWDESNLNYIEVARVIEANGGALVAVHGRTRAQAYSGVARWQPIAEVKDCIKIPVLANGDIRSIRDINFVLETTGCDGVMIGRSALGNPWIFCGIEKSDINLRNRIPVICEHLEMMTDFFGIDFGILLFRKHLKAYLRDLPVPRMDVLGLMTSTSIDELINRLYSIDLSNLVQGDV